MVERGVTLVVFAFLLLQAQIVQAQEKEQWPWCVRRALSLPLSPARGEIHYEIFGAENRETVVLIHGLDSASPTFDSVTSELAKKYRVLVYDQRGHGKTAARGVDYSSETLANDLKALLDALGIQKVNLLGHSMGGRTAIRFAELHPDYVSSLIVEDMETVVRKGALALSGKTLTELAEPIRETFPEGRVFHSREELSGALRPFYGNQTESIIDRRAKAHEDGSYTLLFRPDVSRLYAIQGNSEDLGGSLAKIKVPVLFLRADPRVNSSMSEKGVAEIKKISPRSRVRMIPQSGHVIHRTHPREFLEWVENFIEEVRKK